MIALQIVFLHGCTMKRFFWSAQIENFHVVLRICNRPKASRPSLASSKAYAFPFLYVLFECLVRLCVIVTPPLCCHTGGHGHDGRGAESSTTDAKQRVPKILVGHSLGCVAMVTSFIENPEDVDGLVLVAPAIMASPFKRRAQLLRREVR